VRENDAAKSYKKSYNESKKNWERWSWPGVHCTSCKGIWWVPKA